MSQPKRRKRGFPRFRLPSWAWLLIGVIIASLTGLAAPAAIEQVQAWGMFSQSPRLELSTTEVDLGEGAPNEIVRGTLQLRNTGTAPLEFSIEHSCGCTELRPSEGTIPAGQQVSIALGVRLPGHAGSEKNVGLTVKSNDPERPAVRCAMLARCPAPFEVEPAFVNFGEILDNEVSEVSQAILIDPVEGKPRPTMGRLQIEQDGRFFRVEKQVGSNRSVSLHISLQRGLVHGYHYGALQLRVAGSNCGLTVPVSVHVIKPVSVIPSTIFVRDDGGRNEPRTVEILVRSRQRELPLDDLRLIDPPPGIVIDEVIELHPRLKRLRLVVPNDAMVHSKTVLRLSCKGTEDSLGVTLLSPARPNLPQNAVNLRQEKRHDGS